VWSTKSFIQIARQQFYLGAEEVKSSRFTQNALENLFSVMDAGAIKQSAFRFQQSIRMVSVTHFIWDPVKGSYSWDEEETGKQCFFELIAKESSENSTFHDVNEELYMQYDFQIPETLSCSDLFVSQLEINAFYIEICHFLHRFVIALKCDACKDMLLTNCLDENDDNLLKRQRCDTSSEPTYLVKMFFIKVEYAFKMIQEQNVGAEFRSNFMDLVSARIPSHFIHCASTTEKLVKKYFDFRCSLLNIRNIHNSNKHASRSLR
jgi:hypothetical protein